jgi:hypothetical protein
LGALGIGASGKAGFIEGISQIGKIIVGSNQPFWHTALQQLWASDLPMARAMGPERLCCEDLGHEK